MSKKESFSLEEKLTEIRTIVDKMQRGLEDFDQQVAFFKQGKDLIQQCHSYLNEAEMEINKLVNGEEEAMEFRFSSENE